MEDIQSASVRNMVLCRLMSPKQFRDLGVCKKCEYHRGIKLIQPENKQNKWPAVYAVTCSVPVEVPIQNIIEEGITTHDDPEALPFISNIEG